MKPNDAFEEKRELLTEEIARLKEKIRPLVNHWAKITSAAVVILSYIQYSYKYGICKVFRLPASAISINLLDYIPVAALLCAIAVYLFDCYISLNPRNAEGKTCFSLFRIVCGTAITFIVSSTFFDNNRIHLLQLLLISVVPPLILEFIWRNRRLRRIKAHINERFQNRLKSDAGNRPFYKYYLKPALICVLIVILTIPFLSEIVTSHKTVYEICLVGEEKYAVILDSSIDTLVQPAVIEANSLTIDTGTYRFVSKTDIGDFVFQKFDRVTIARS